jgi:HD-like signal output (HDOD) protein
LPPGLALRIPAAPHTRGIVVRAALVHDVGKLVLSTRPPRHFARALFEAHWGQVPLYANERQLAGVTHAKVGAYLLGIWGWPSPVVEAVAHPHHPEAAIPNDVLDSVGIVQIANILAHEAATGPSHSSAIPHQTIEPGYLDRFGIADQYRDWLEMANAMATNATASR